MPVLSVRAMQDVVRGCLHYLAVVLLRASWNKSLWCGILVVLDDCATYFLPVHVVSTSKNPRLNKRALKTLKKVLETC